MSRILLTLLRAGIGALILLAVLLLFVRLCLITQAPLLKHLYLLLRPTYDDTRDH